MKFPQPNGLRIALITLLICVQASVAFAQIIDPENSPLDCATYIAQKLAPEELSFFELYRIAQINWKLGHTERVLSLIKQTPCLQRAVTANLFTKLALENKSFENAYSYIKEARSCYSEENSLDKSVLFESVSYLAQLKKFDEAFSVMGLIEDDPTYRALSLLKIAEAKIDSGQLTEADFLLQRALSEARLGDATERNSTLRTLDKIAILYTKIGNKSAAVATLEEALTIAEKDDDKDSLKHSIAITYSKCGLITEAEKLANTLPKSEKMYILLSIAKQDTTQAKSNRVAAQLREITSSIDASENGNDTAYNNVVSMYLEQSNAHMALQVAKKIMHPFYACKAAKSIANWCFDQKKHSIAIEAIDYASDIGRKIISEKSEDIPASASHSQVQTKSQVLSEIIDLYLQANQYEKALECAQAIDHPQHRANKLADVAAAMKTSSKNSKADKLILSALKLSESAPYHSHDRQQDSTLLNIARRLAETGNRAQSLKIFTKLLKEARDQNTRVEQLAEIGYNFELSGLQANKEIQLLLREIAKDWLEE